MFCIGLVLNFVVFICDLGLSLGNAREMGKEEVNCIAGCTHGKKDCNCPPAITHIEETSGECHKESDCDYYMKSFCSRVECMPGTCYHECNNGCQYYCQPRR